MSTVREAKRRDAPALLSLVDGIADMPERAREAARRSVLRAVGEGDGGDETRCLVCVKEGGSGPAGLVCYRPVPLARSALDIDWLVVAPEITEPREVVEALVGAVRDAPSPTGNVVRFLAGRWQRGGLEPHVLDGAGMARAGAIEGFFGAGDDLLLFASRSTRPRAEDLDPTNAASLCDAAFAYRDFDGERDFLLACAASFGGRNVRRAASWGCGTGRHLRSLAERGVDGVGIDDVSESLVLAEAAYRATCGESTRATWVLARLDDPVTEARVDLSFAMLSAVHRVGSAESMVRHLRHVADLLAPGGVHVIEATLPVDATPEGNTQTVWTVRRGPFEITSRFRILVERRSHTGAVPTVLDVRCKRQETGEMIGGFHQEELWIVPDAEGWRELVARAGRFAVAAILGDFQLDVAWDQPGAWRMLVVLRRTEDP